MSKPSLTLSALALAVSSAVISLPGHATNCAGMDWSSRKVYVGGQREAR